MTNENKYCERKGRVAMRSYNRGSDLFQLIRDSFAEEVTSELRSEGALGVLSKGVDEVEEKLSRYLDRYGP